MPLGISLNHRPLGLDSRPLFRRLLKLRLAAALRLIEAVRLRPRRPSQTLSELRLVSEITKERDYEVLKRCRLIPSFLIFDSSVCRGMPSLVAAPAGPEISPSASRSAVSIISFSWSIRFATRGTLDAALFGVTGISQLSSTEKVSPSLRITARSITFCNSRTLPGQS